jgi:hypothetical protein
VNNVHVFIEHCSKFYTLKAVAQRWSARRERRRAAPK